VGMGRMATHARTARRSHTRMCTAAALSPLRLLLIRRAPAQEPVVEAPADRVEEVPVGRVLERVVEAPVERVVEVPFER
jgi:hypothetical protein